jgi:hypothetical protein
LWIPFYGKIKWAQFTPPVESGLHSWYELGYVPSDAGGYDRLMDPKTPSNERAAGAVGMIVDALVKLPFSGDLAEKITLYLLINLRVLCLLSRYVLKKIEESEEKQKLVQ